MLLSARPLFVSTLLLLREDVPRSHGAYLQLFPDGPDPTDAASAPQGLSSMDNRPVLTRDELVGFWQIFDDQASEDALNGMAQGETPNSIFSSKLVLRADGQTSRGSDFPGGSWSMREEAGADGSPRKRLSVELRSRLLKQEWRYDGVLFALQTDEPPPTAGIAGASAGGSNRGPGPLEIRVAGSATKWDISDETTPQPIGEATSFSMVKMAVDRRKLVPTIKPFSAAVDPEAVKLEMEWRKQKEDSEEEDLRRAIADVRDAKAQHGDEWMERIQPVEGVDYWRPGEEPGAEQQAVDSGSADPIEVDLDVDDAASRPGD